jgi:uncharacterized repeat protein (TIGR01451 family)
LTSTPIPITPTTNTPTLTPTLTPTPVPASVIDVALTKTTDKRKVKLGDIVTFTVTVSNEVSQGALGVQVKDLLPTSLQYLGHETSYGTYDTTSGIWNIGNLNYGYPQTLKLVTRVARTSDLTNFAEVYAHEQKDRDSLPNNGKNGEDDNAMVELTYDPGEVMAASVTSKGGVLADTGYGVLLPLIAGMIFFVSLLALAESHPTHKLVLKVIHSSTAAMTPSAPDSSSTTPAIAPSSHPFLTYTQVRLGIVIVGITSGVIFTLSGISFTQTLLAAREKIQRGIEAVQELDLVAAGTPADPAPVTLTCGAITENPLTLSSSGPVSLKIKNTTAHQAYLAIPGIDVLASIAPQAESVYPVAPATLQIPEGVWYAINPVYCPGSTTMGITKLILAKENIPTSTPIPTTIPTIIRPPLSPKPTIVLSPLPVVTKAPTPPPGCKYETILPMCAQYVDPVTGLTGGGACEPITQLVCPTSTPKVTISPSPIVICDYAAPPPGCTYVQGPKYDPASQCGMILSCPTPTPVPPTPTFTPTKSPTPTPMLGCAASSIICGTKTTQNCYFVCGSCTNPSDQRCNECKRCDVATTNIYCSAPASAHGTSITVSGSGCATTASCSNAVWSVPNKCTL